MRKKGNGVGDGDGDVGGGGHGAGIGWKREMQTGLEMEWLCK